MPSSRSSGIAPETRVLWVDGSRDVREQMRRDAALLGGVAGESGTAAVLRVYRFAPAGVTLGRAQRAEVELDLERCRALGVDWAV